MQRRSTAVLKQLEEELAGVKATKSRKKQKTKSAKSEEELQKLISKRKESNGKWDQTVFLAFQAKAAAGDAKTDEDFEKAVDLIHQSIEHIPEYYIEKTMNEELFEKHKNSAFEQDEF
ncbi:hypothetical protein HDV00_005273 [Rhizophlyctis rosea]|nr:hypothetical protein HDV00_005273 [Rhizophlyctis rosea]